MGLLRPVDLIGLCMIGPFNVHLLSHSPARGMGSCFYPIPPLGEWDLVFVWFHLPYYYTRSSSSSSKGWSDFTLLLKLSQ